MNPSDDTETSCSTSSSSSGPGSRPERVAVGASPGSEVWSPAAVEHARSGAPSPSCAGGRGGGGEWWLNDARAFESQGKAPHDTATYDDDDDTTRVTVTSPARRRTEASSTTARNRRGGEDKPTYGSNSPRQRPLSAPPKVYQYPFSRQSELGKEEASTGRLRSRETIGGQTGTTDGSAEVLEPDGCKTVRGRDGKGDPGRDANLTSQQRLSLSSIFGSASERRTSENKQSDARSSMLVSENEGAVKRGIARSAFLEGRNEGGDGSNAGASLSPQTYGLHRWKEYAVLRHGGNKRFVNSQHGREILVETASTIRTKEVADLNRELKEMRALVQELHSALHAEQVEKSNLQAKIVLLEREVEGMDFARRRWLRENASNRGRGSNLERRLAGNTGNLRTFLFGADAKPEATRQLATRDASEAPGTFRPSATCSGSPVASSRAHSGVGGAATTASEMSTGEEGDRDMAAIGGTTAERNAVRRARETAELERSELRRRHDVEMTAKQSRIERLKLEVRRLEAERDGLKQAAETQVGLFKDGYAELKTCLEEMKAHGQSPPPDTSRSPADSCSEEQARPGGDGRGTIKSAEGRERWMQTMLATEEGLNCQVRMLQGLLLEAVSAATPTVVMPAAVTQAVDSIRQGLGLPPLVHSPERAAPALRGMPFSSSSRYPTAAAAATVAVAESMHSSSDLETAGCGPHRESGVERHFRQGPRVESPTQYGPSERGQQSRHYHHQIHGDRRPPGLTATPDATSVSSTAESTTTDKRLEVDATGGTSSQGKVAGRDIRPNDVDDDDNSSCTGSEGSGTLWVRVAPTDESSSVEEDLNSPSSQASYRHHGIGPGASRWRGRDDILERYLGGGRGGVPNENPEPEGQPEGNQPSHEWPSSPRARSAAGPGNGRRSRWQTPERGSIRNSDTDRPHSGPGEETLIRNLPDESGAGAERGNRRRRMLGAKLAASGGAMSVGSLEGMRTTNPSDTRPCVLDVVEHDGSLSGDGKCTRNASSEGWGRRDKLPAGVQKAISNEFDGHR
ncbi:hypothetical protein Esi_0067_0016 [Ectocarpus siliculosus]|uniref:Uncharacterized protein n=1 Tax=Ectocarpus siliculosus TaxID=2880 RepID=D7G5P3_ECTSI|nr:hypothetical protein Esi_0067_0016 [Ectocarpus siliculosus]|eukprot:CBJ27340.1 hypothetical protein Esi_0067_0016 [Ectocarpus siliculosus]